MLPVVEDLEEGVLPPRRREQDPLHTRHHCWAPPSRPRPAVHSLAPQAEHVDLGIVRMAQPCDREHACNRKADRDPFTRSLHARPPHGHHAEPDQRDEAKSQVTALRAETPTGSRPQTYALRCVAHRYPISPDSKVTRNKKPQVRCLTWGSPQSRLRDSNPRPTHYETTSDRVARCPAVLRSDVAADQSTCNGLTPTARCCTVQRRPATGRPPRALWPRALPPPPARHTGCGRPTGPGGFTLRRAAYEPGRERHQRQFTGRRRSR